MSDGSRALWVSNLTLVGAAQRRFIRCPLIGKRRENGVMRRQEHVVRDYSEFFVAFVMG
jgi:hypothetical protein